MNRGAGITHKAYIYKYAKDTISRRALEDSRLDVEPYLLINVGPVIYSRVRVVSYNLVPNSISSNTYIRKSSISASLSFF
jgi:hypothetical protein